MEMEILDNVRADLLAEGDSISFDGPICTIKEINEVNDTDLQFISEDDREIVHSWDTFVDVYGYGDVEV